MRMVPKTKSQINIRKNSKGSPHSRDSLSGDMLIVMIILLMGIALLPSHSPTPTVSSRSIKSFHKDINKMDSYLDKQLQDAAIKAELNANKVQIDNQNLAPALDETDSLRRNRNQGISELNRWGEVPEDKSLKVYSDFSLPKAYDDKDNPVARIDTLLARKQFLQTYERQQREEYVRQIIENAAHDGFGLTINNKLEIVGIRPIKNKNDLNIPPRNRDLSHDHFAPNPFDPVNKE